MIIDTTNTSKDYWKGIYEALQAKYYNVFILEGSSCFSTNVIARYYTTINIKHSVVTNKVLTYHNHTITNLGDYSRSSVSIDLGSIEDKLNQITEEYE